MPSFLIISGRDEILNAFVPQIDMAGRWRCCRPCSGKRQGAIRLLDEDQEGPRASDERHCTDVMFIVLFALTMVVFALVGAVSLRIGDTSRLRFGEDHLGRQCGTGELKHLPKMYFPLLGRDLLSQRDLISTPWKLHLFGVCTAACPRRGDRVTDFGRNGPGWPVTETTLSVLNRCVPTVEESSSKMCAQTMPARRPPAMPLPLLERCALCPPRPPLAPQGGVRRAAL